MLGLPDEKIKMGLSPEAKAENVKEGDVFFDDKPENLDAVSKTGAEVVDTKTETVKEETFKFGGKDYTVKEGEFYLGDKKVGKAKQIKIKEAYESRKTRTERTAEDKSSKTTTGGAEKPKAKVFRVGTRKKFRKINHPEYKKALKVESFEPEDMALQYFIGGGKITTDVIKGLFKNSKGEVKARLGLINNKGEGKNLNEIAHSLWETLPKELRDIHTDLDIREALENAIKDHSGTASMVKRINERLIS